MSIHTSYNSTTNTYTVAIGKTKLTGISLDDYLQFMADVRDGKRNAVALMQEARIRHARSVSA